jgi:hypothetical protein
MTPTGQAPRRYRVSDGVYYYLTDFDRYLEYNGFGEATSEMDTSIPANDAELDLHQRSLFWTLALFTLGHEFLNQTVAPPGYPISVSVGYFDPHTEVNAFGVAISIDQELLPYEIFPPNLFRCFHCEPSKINVYAYLASTDGPITVR